MPLVPFPEFLEGEGLAFGIPPAVLSHIGRDTEAGRDIGALLDDPAVAKAGLLPVHLLKIRRAWHRHRALCALLEPSPGPANFRDRTGIAAAKFAMRLAKTDPDRLALAGAFVSLVAATLKRGLLRIHRKRPDQALPDDPSGLAEHTEGCAEIPPHRWFAASRGVADDLLWVEVVPPEGEAERALGSMVTAALAQELSRAAAKSVLDAIGERSEDGALSTAADALAALLGRPPLEAPVVGVVADARKLRAYVLGGEQDGQETELGVREADQLASWIQKQEVQHVGMAAVAGRKELAAIVQVLAGRGLVVEWVREAGLMKQARGQAGPIKATAARVAAQRLRDPLQGYAGLEADELGLGEYLDRVNPERLRAALEDVRGALDWERRHGKNAPAVARGVTLSPMVKGLSDLRPGMELSGTVANLTHFGAFIELGLSVQGLVHLSELSDRFIQHPSEVVQVGDRVRVRVLEIDEAKGRLSLTMRSDSDPRKKGSREKRVQALNALDGLFKK